MLRSLYAGKTWSSGYCLLCSKKTVQSLSEQAGRNASLTEFSTPELPLSEIYRTSYPELFFFHSVS